MSALFKLILTAYNEGVRQQHECTCGPASVNLVAKAMGFAGMREADWRKDEFNRWMPIEQFLVRGMALHELQLTSELLYANRLEIVLRRVFKENLPSFKQSILLAAISSDFALVLNYCQDDFQGKTSNKQGNPHYSVIAGFDPERDKILMADVDQDIKESYWVDVQEMFNSMAKSNPAFGIPRGWLELRKRAEQ